MVLTHTELYLRYVSYHIHNIENQIYQIAKKFYDSEW